jgi:hypothetical protein
MRRRDDEDHLGVHLGEQRSDLGEGGHAELGLSGGSPVTDRVDDAAKLDASDPAQSDGVLFSTPPITDDRGTEAHAASL